MIQIIEFFIDWFVHLDTHLVALIDSYGILTYAILFIVIFLETGVVVTPFLPGDSLLFAAGALASLGSLHLGWLIVLLIIAAILGDSVNYWIGKFFGERVMHSWVSRFLKKEYINKTESFYHKHGNKTIVLARFVPIVRTVAPFLAGVGNMNYRKFLLYNVTGGIVWVFLFTMGGFLFGDMPFVKEQFSWVILGIIFITVIPIGIEMIRDYFTKKRNMAK